MDADDLEATRTRVLELVRRLEADHDDVAGRASNSSPSTVTRAVPVRMIHVSGYGCVVKLRTLAWPLSTRKSETADP
jgi:hypothetical protein